jgi:hypothetical protein
MTPTVAVVLVNYNGWADTVECLRSLANITYSRWFPVVVDNASVDDPSRAILEQFPGCAVIRRERNGGWAGGNNTGIQLALRQHVDFVLLLNNDTRVAPNLIDRLIEAAEANREFGVLGPVIRNFDPPSDIQTEGCNFNRAGRPEFFQRQVVALCEASPPAIAEVDIVNGCCMMVRSTVFRKAGLIDERFFLIHEESDFCLRARRAGFRCGVIGEALVWHKGSQSFRRSGLRIQRYYDARNLFLLLAKHPRLHGARRGRMRSMWEYLKYSYARFEQEREAGCDDAADAVLEGVCDAIQRRFGAYRPRRRLGLNLLKYAFEWRLRTRAGSAGTGA